MGIDPPRDRYEGLRPFCTECKREIMDGEWAEFLMGEIIVCHRCIQRNMHTIEELEV